MDSYLHYSNPNYNKEIKRKRSSRLPEANNDNKEKSWLTLVKTTEQMVKNECNPWVNTKKSIMKPFLTVDLLGFLLSFVVFFSVLMKGNNLEKLEKLNQI